MQQWHRFSLIAIGIGLLLVWPVRWFLTGLPDGLTEIEGGGAWPLHLLAEALTAALCIWAASSPRARPVGLLALGTVCYGAINGLSYGLYGDPWQTGLAAIKLAAGAVLIEALRQKESPVAKAAPRWPGVLLALLGLGMIAFWTMQVTVESILTDGLLTAEGDGYLIYHMIAEVLAGATALIGGTALLLRRALGASLSLIGAGGVLYAAVNSLGWAVLHDAALGIVFVVTILLTTSAAGRLSLPRKGAAS